MSESMFKTPLIEAELDPRVTLPVFIKALTHGARVIELPADFAERPDHLERARQLAAKHWRRYQQEGRHKNFPLLYYKYIVTPGHSYRISLDGRITGRFNDRPVAAFVKTEDGERFTFG
ncbi:hypothetical protein [Oceanithermus sp.]